jgi:hypothetical protein
VKVNRRIILVPIFPGAKTRIFFLPLVVPHLAVPTQQRYSTRCMSTVSALYNSPTQCKPYRYRSCSEHARLGWRCESRVLVLRWSMWSVYLVRLFDPRRHVSLFGGTVCGVTFVMSVHLLEHVRARHLLPKAALFLRF